MKRSASKKEFKMPRSVVNNTGLQKVFSHARKVVTSIGGQKTVLDVHNALYDGRKPTKKGIEFCKLILLLRFIHMEKKVDTLLLTWRDLAALLKGPTFEEERLSTQNALIEGIRTHIPEMLRLAGSTSLAPRYRFCITPVPVMAFEDKWQQQLPHELELDRIYKSRRKYEGVHVSLSQNGAVLVAYLNRNNRIGERMVLNATTVANSLHDAGLIGTAQVSSFGLSSVELIGKYVNQAASNESHKTTIL